MKIKLLLTVISMIAVPTITNASMMDFEGFSDTNSTEGTLTSFTSGDGDFSVTLSAGSTQGGTNYDPYLDYNNAGVGVCKDSSTSAWPDSGANNKCVSGADDDNLQNLEFLRLDFGEYVAVSDFFFNDSHHNYLYGNVMFAIDGGDFINYAFMDGINESLSISATTIDITIGHPMIEVDETGYLRDEGYREYDYSELYLSKLEVNRAPVPEPSILALIGLGIFGFGLSRRKLKK